MMNDITDFAYFLYCYAFLAVLTGLAAYFAFTFARAQAPNFAAVCAIVAATALASGIAADFDGPLFAAIIGIVMAMPLWLFSCGSIIVVFRKKDAAFLGVACGLAALTSYVMPTFLPVLIPASPTQGAGPDVLQSLMASDAFGAIMVALAAVTTIAMPLFIIGILAVHLFAPLSPRRFRDSLFIMSVPLAWAIAYTSGMRISDAIVLTTAGRSLQSNFLRARGGVVLARTSADQSFQLLTNDLAAYSMGGFVDTPEFLVYDARPVADTRLEEIRIHRRLGAGCSSIVTRRIANNDYFVRFGC